MPANRGCSVSIYARRLLQRVLRGWAAGRSRRSRGGRRESAPV